MVGTSLHWTEVLTVCVLVIFTTLSLTQSSATPPPSSSSCATLTVNATLTLQNAMDDCVSPDSIAMFNCITIYVPPGNHTLTSQILLPEDVGSIEIIGLVDGDDDVYVACDHEDVIVANYTWYFDGLETVKIKGLQFENCPRPLRLDTIDEVEILSCSFRFFTEAVLDVFNCHHVFMNDSLLENNQGSGIVNASYRGNTGGVSFGYNTLPLEFNTPQLLVSHSKFRNNRATATSAFRTSSQAFFAQIFTGRGGALAIFSNESNHDLNLTISDCLFENNTARSFGGGVYLLLGGFTTHHKIRVERVNARYNTAQLGGGGFQASFFNNGPEEDPLLMSFVECEFSNNRGIAGGAIFVITSTDGGIGNLVQMRSTVFSGNRGYLEGPNDYGAAVALSLLNPLVERTNFPRHEITDCTFDSNSGANGIVSVGYSPMNFTGTNIFSNNIGSALRVVGSLIYLSGELHFINNTNGDDVDSALHMLSFGQAVFRRGLFVSFHGNTGRFGASISIEAITTSTVYTQLAANPQCPFLYEDLDIVPEDWNDVTVHFSSNTAILGSALYVSRLNTCSWYSRSAPFFNNTFIVDWPIWNIDDSNQDTGYTEDEQMISTLSVQTQLTRLIVTNQTVRAWPGLRLTLGISGWDEFKHTTTATAGFSFRPLKSDSLNIPDIRFIPEVVVVGPDPNTGLLTRYFTVYYGIGGGMSSSELISSIDGLIGNVTIQDPIETLPVEPAQFQLEALICPAGYVLRPHPTQTGISVCTCNEEIADLLLCEDDQETIVIRRGKWAVYVPSDPQNNLDFYACPMGYCRCRHDSSVSNNTCVYSYSHSDPDSQCACSRRGTLCGECRDVDEGVSSLLNECVSCDGASGLFILALIIADAVVIIVLVFLDKPIPSWIYPFIFYIQLAPVMGLDFPDSFIKIGKYLYFLGSASGFYFIYDFCLYGNMSSQMAYFLRYLPLFVGIITCTPIIIGRSYLYRKLLKRKPLKHHGLWLVLLLGYSHLVYTSMTILNCPSITNTNGQTTPRWYVNGEIECFTGSHIALGLLAIIVLLIAILLIPCIWLIATERLKLYGLKFLHSPLVLVYKKQYRWWASVELGRRFLLLLLTVSLPQNEVVRVFVVAIYTTVYSYTQPYCSRLANYVETAVNLNFLFLLLINATSFFNDDFFIFSTLTGNSMGGGDSHCSSVSSIAVVSWILMPFYYLPILGGCIIAIVLTILFIRDYHHRKWSVKEKDGVDDTGVVYNMYGTGTGPHQSWTVQLPDNVTESCEGYLDLNMNNHKKLRRGLTVFRNPVKSNTHNNVFKNSPL